MRSKSRNNGAGNAGEVNIMRKRVEKSWVLLVKDTILSNHNFSIISLPHPANGNSTKYCLDNENNKLYEVMAFSEPYRSWFIGETVKSDGSLLMATPMKPLFLGKYISLAVPAAPLVSCLYIDGKPETVLPKLREQCQERAVPLEDLLSDKGYDKIVDFINDLDNVADLKGDPELRAYKYNEEKTLKWLEDRVRRLAKVLRAKNIHVTSGCVSATFVVSNVTNDGIDEEFYLKYAHGMISEYLEEDLINKLEVRFNFKPDLIESVGKKRKSEANNQNESNKKIKYNDGSNENYVNETRNFDDTKKQKPLTSKEKARQKAASGTKTISSFFAKK